MFIYDYIFLYNFIYLHMIAYICIYNHLFIQEIYAQLQQGKDLEGWNNSLIRKRCMSLIVQWQPKRTFLGCHIDDKSN